MDKAPFPVSIQSHVASVVVFNGLNYAEWSEQVQFHLGALDLDLALLHEKPVTVVPNTVPTVAGNQANTGNQGNTGNDGNTEVEATVTEQCSLKDWERSNRLSLMFIRMTVAPNIKATLPTYETAKELMAALKDKSQTADKSLGSTLMAELTTMKFDGSVSMHDHLLQMTSKAAKLNSLGFTVDESFLVQFILNSLPQDVWGPFRLTYNIQSER